MSGALDELFATILTRRGADPAQSYTARLFARGPAHIGRKIGEEAVEIVVEAVREDRARLVAESADLLYHLCVLWAAMGIAPDQVWAELKSRRAESSDGL